MRVNLRTPLSRRHLLKAGGVALALPALNAMLPRSATAGAATHEAPMRMVLVARNLGLHAPFLFPDTPGPAYEATRYLRHLEPNRGRFTIFSGMSHPDYDNHHSEPGLFTAVHWDRIKEPTREHHNTISLDQYVAERIGAETRFRNLVIGPPVQWHFSWTSKGVPVPTERQPTKVFQRLFIDGTPEEVRAEVERLKTGRSILDQVGEQARDLTRGLGPDDRRRLDLMFGAIRDTERAMLRNESWATTPKPAVAMVAPKSDPANEDLVGKETLWFDIVRLALQTDSTRVILLTMGDAGRVKLDGLTLAHHDASHHGKDDTKIEQLAIIEEAEIVQFNRFLSSMDEVRDGDATLLDRTVVLNASNLGNASAHSSRNLPILLAGGGFKHPGHVRHDRDKNTPLANLFVRMLHRLGIDDDRFGESTGVIDEV
jgi:hypothetical protein